MELLKYDASWFKSAAGQSYFSQLHTLEDKSVFMYSYLKKLAPAEFDKDQILFKTALFLADAVYGSALPYGAFPNFTDPQKNPYIAYLSTATNPPQPMVLWAIYASILHGTVDPVQRDSWIYQKFDGDLLSEELKEVGCNFGFHPAILESPSRFDIQEELQLVQMKLAWFFAKA